jgi:hypothetical protein
MYPKFCSCFRNRYRCSIAWNSNQMKGIRQPKLTIKLTGYGDIWTAVTIFVCYHAFGILLSLLKRILSAKNCNNTHKLPAEGQQPSWCCCDGQTPHLLLLLLPPRIIITTTSVWPWQRLSGVGEDPLLPASLLLTSYKERGRRLFFCTEKRVVGVLIITKGGLSVSLIPYTGTQYNQFVAPCHKALNRAISQGQKKNSKKW